MHGDTMMCQLHFIYTVAIVLLHPMVLKHCIQFHISTELYLAKVSHNSNLIRNFQMREQFVCIYHVRLIPDCVGSMPTKYVLVCHNTISDSPKKSLRILYM